VAGDCVGVTGVLWCGVTRWLFVMVIYRKLDLRENQLSGSIPLTLGSLTALE
jgi:hypothetical protein